MSKPQHDADLMAFADGELDEHASRELEDGLARDGSARAKVDAIGELGDLVRGHLELSADSVPQKRFDALWREIDKGIASLGSAEARSGADAPQRLIDRAAPAVETTKQAARVDGGALRKVGRWFDRYRGHILTGAVSAGAVAALALLLRNPTPELHDQTAGKGSGMLEPTLVNTHEPAEIESMDTPDGTGTVFNLEDEDGSTTVIWVTPDDTVEGI